VWRHTRLSVSTLGLALVAAALLASSFSLSRIAAWIPRTVLAVVLALLVIQLGIEVRGRMRAVPSAPVPGSTGGAPRAPGASVTPTVAILWLGGALLAVLLLGVTIGSALFTVAFLRGHAGDGWRSSGTFALALGAGLELFFAQLLQVQLYPGWLGQMVQ
jgi:hypothetical protein